MKKYLHVLYSDIFNEEEVNGAILRDYCGNYVFFHVIILSAYEMNTFCLVLQMDSRCWLEH